jgi:hypothetical protein
MSADEIITPDNPEPFPASGLSSVPPAVASEPVPESAFPAAPVNPYNDFTPAEQLVLSKLDTIIVQLEVIGTTTHQTHVNVGWIGTQFQNLLNTVANIGASGVGPMGLFKMLKGGN